MERLLFMHLVKVLHKVLYLRCTENEFQKKKMELDAGGCIDDFGQAEIVAFHPGLGVGDGSVVLGLIPLDVDGGYLAIVVGAVVSLQKNEGRDDGRYRQGTVNVFS